jgi:hypothetical protein
VCVIYCSRHTSSYSSLYTYVYYFRWAGIIIEYVCNDDKYVGTDRLCNNSAWWMMAHFMNAGVGREKCPEHSLKAILLQLRRQLSSARIHMPRWRSNYQLIHAGRRFNALVRGIFPSLRRKSDFLLTPLEILFRHTCALLGTRSPGNCWKVALLYLKKGACCVCTERVMNMALVLWEILHRGFYRAHSMLNSEIDTKIPPTLSTVTDAIILMAITWIGRGHNLEISMHQEKIPLFFTW